MSPLLSHLGRSGASSGFALGLFGILGCPRSWGGRKGKQNIPCGCPKPGTPCTLRSSSLGPCPPGINKPRENSHPGVSWVNKCLRERAGCGESPAGLGIGEFNTPALPGCAQVWISPWDWISWDRGFPALVPPLTEAPAASLPQVAQEIQRKKAKFAR